MEKITTALSVTFGIIMAALFSEWLARFLEQDSRLNAGGAYDLITGFCREPRGRYVAQFARPGLYLFWSAVVTLQAIVGTITYALVRRLFDVFLRLAH